MALVFADLVRAYTSSEGTGAIVPGAAAEGHRGFADVLSEGDRFHYSIAGVTIPSQWEVGEGILLPGGSFARSPAASSSGGGAVDLAPGVKTVTLTVASGWFEGMDALPDALNGLEADAAALAGQVAALQGRSAVLAAQIAGVEAAAGGLAGQVAALDAGYDNLSAEVAALDAGKAALAGASFTGAVSAPSLALAAPLPVASGGTGATTATGTGNPVRASGPTLEGARLVGTTRLSGGQLAFPAVPNPSSDPRTLDDYAEGAFTPALKFGGGSAGMASSTFGRYLKIGSAVFFELRVSLTVKGTATGAATIAGLPFGSEGTAGSGTIGAALPFDLSGIAALATSIASASTAVSLWNVSGGTASALTHANFVDTSQIYVSGLYRV